ncbi:recombinase family protein [Bacillus tropicus]|uniref:recombinase family protein n=1 Tax=Bacillus tropicus TaxID=2026188 RepID=UPI0021BD0810|nr:recombinase family protein [Bacillus tropicus]
MFFDISHIGVLIYCHKQAEKVAILHIKYGYIRVHTLQRDLESQIQILEKAGCEEIYSEKSTITSVSRTRFQELLSKLGPRYTIVVRNLDRLVRNTREGITIIEGFTELFPDFSKIKDLPYREGTGNLSS